MAEWSFSELPRTAGQLFNQVTVCKFHSANGRSWENVVGSIGQSGRGSWRIPQEMPRLVYMQPVQKQLPVKAAPGINPICWHTACPYTRRRPRLGLSIMQLKEEGGERNAVGKAVLTFSRRRREMWTDRSATDECLSTPKQGNWISVGYSSIDS